MVSLVHLNDRKSHSNTTLVKVKSIYNPISIFFVNYSNTTLVKVKYSYEEAVTALGYRFKYNSC